MAPAAKLARPPRIPKLTYRNPLPASEDASISSQTTLTEGASHDTFKNHNLPTPPATPLSRLEFDSRSTTSSRSTSLASSDGSVSRESKASSAKKKKNGVLNFLTLKEPSQLALEQLANAQRKQASAKSSQSTPVGMQGISPQKLPPTVPKVNSKWDGVPESVKSSRNSLMTNKSKRTSTMSGSSYQASQIQPSRSVTLNSSMISVATTESRGPTNSLASPMHSAIDLSDHTESSSSSKALSRSDSTSTTSFPDTTSFFPDEPNSSGALPASRAEHPWSPPPHPSELDTDPSLVFVTQFGEKLAISEPDTVTSGEVDAIFRKLKGEAGEAHDVSYGADDDDPDVPDTHDFLFDVKPIFTEPPTRAVLYEPVVQPAPPATVPSNVPSGRPSANFSRPRPIAPHPNPPRSSTNGRYYKSNAPSLPTLYEVSIASTDDTDAMSDTTELGRRDSTESTESTSAHSIAASTAPSVATSFTPSVMSASWYRSPRERLGLGGRIRKSEVLPWESQKEPATPAPPVLHPLHMHPVESRAI